MIISKIITITGVAGSGKTTYMLNLATNLAKEEDIWVIALTNRGIRMIEEKNENIKTTTIHSFANRIINYGNGEERKEVMDDDYKQIVFEGNYKLKYIPNVRGYEIVKLPNGNKVDFIKRKILNLEKRLISECKINSLDRIIEETKKEINLSLSTTTILNILHDYENYLIRNNKVDFDYMLLLASQRIENVEFNEKILAWDEINDSLPLAVELVWRAIKSNKFEYFILNGDPAQTIYDNLLFTNPEEFYNFYKNSDEKILLPKTVRLPKKIVDFVNNIYVKIPSRHRIIDTIVTEKFGGEVYSIDYDAMINVIPRLISREKQNVGVVVLSNYRAKQVSDFLTERGIPNFCFYEGSIYGWPYEICVIRNFLLKCKNKIFEENFISEYNVVRDFLPPEYRFFNLSMFNRENIIQLFSDYIKILKSIEIKDWWKEKIYNSIQRFNVDFERSVEILTVHSAKGVEFDNVFTILEPTRDLINNNLDEKKRSLYRRLLYTAITRGKLRLFLVGREDILTL